MFSNVRNYLNRKSILAAAVAALMLVPLLASGALVFAQESGGSGLSISPTRTELSLLPGTTDEVVVSIRNITSGPIIASVFINDFEPDNNTGEPKLVTDPERRNAASISGFLSAPEDVRLDPGENKDVSLAVTIPSDAAPGGYYGAIRFKATPEGANQDDTNGSEVSLTANLLSLVLIEVPGDIIEKVAVNSVQALIDDESGSVFTKSPNFVGIEIQNLGNSFVKPFGSVIVSRMGGGEVFSYELNDANPRSNVLPESTRVFKTRLENIEKKIVNGEEVESRTSVITTPGRYTVTANVSYGNGGEIFTVTSSFWYIPVWLIAVLVVVLAALVAGAYFMYRKYVTKSTRRR